MHVYPFCPGLKNHFSSEGGKLQQKSPIKRFKDPPEGEGRHLP